MPYEPGLGHFDRSKNYVWDPNALQWVRMVQADASGVDDGITIEADNVGLARQAQFPASLGQTNAAGSLSVVLASNQPTIPVSGSFTTTEATSTALEVDAATSVGANTQTTVATYTAVADTAITQIMCSGQEYAKFQIYTNTALVATLRSGPDRNAIFSFTSPLELSNTSVLDVKVTHFVTGETPDFEATIFGY